MSLGEQALRKFHMIGDHVLIRPKAERSKTRSGLYLPPGIQKNEEIASGFVLKAGPGYAIPSEPYEDEAWLGEPAGPDYIPLQVREGDEAIYLQKSGYEIEFNRKKYVIVPQTAILMVIRDEEE